MKLSIIMPVYNVEAYLPRALHSILSQGDQDGLEVIAVNDGSTDDSAGVLRWFAKDHSNLTVVHHAINSGASAARNIGLKIARGEYVAFMDSDDWVDDGYYQTLYQAAQKYDADVAAGGAKMLLVTDPHKEYIIKSYSHSILRSIEEKINVLQTEKSGSAWDKVYRRKAITQNDIYFAEDMTTAEDKEWLHRVLDCTTKVVTVPNKFYHYLARRPGSLSLHAKGDQQVAQKYAEDFYRAENRRKALLTNRSKNAIVSKRDNIFIQIASYRDSELPKTIKSCLENAAHPENLSFGICHQFDNSTLHLLDEYRGRPNFRITELPWQESRGVGVARRATGDLWRKEEFTLQIDSHMRFARGWDEDLIRQWRSLNDAKAVLTSYPLSFRYENGDEIIDNLNGAIKIMIKDFFATDIPIYKSQLIEARYPLYKGCFFCGCLAFSRGDILQDCPYIRDITFVGEEIARSVQIFTHGYNVYLPNTPRIFHLYGRPRAKHHWSDAQKAHDLTMTKMTDHSYQLVRDILQRRNTKYLGTVRSIEEFEKFAGIDFRNHLISSRQDTQFEPPFESDFDWAKTILSKSSGK